jgi:DNA-binding beta-propeller fold protein YncE
MKQVITIIILSTIAACQPSGNKKPAVNAEVTPAYKLELLWQSDTLLRTPESVLMDPAGEVLYVSNVNLNPWEKDGNGFISKLDKSGNILNLKWVEGLNGPKGMGISGKSLFIADIDQVVEAELETGKIIGSYAVEGNPQLNDITVGEEGTVYISGSGSNTIYRLKDGKPEALFTGNEGERFNGLLREKDRMLLITSGSGQFKSVIPETGEVKVLAENMGHGDAIVPVGNGDYITTNWSGAVFYVPAEDSVQKLLDTEALGENAADACFDIAGQVLYLPTFFKNRVKAYRLMK